MEAAKALKSPRGLRLSEARLVEFLKTTAPE
jgi:hypothetical protein